MKLRYAFVAALLLATGCPKSKGSGMADPCKDPCKDQKPALTFDGPLAAGQWEGMDHEQREEFMEQVVEPAMKKHFQEFDADGFAEFGCKTCHGANADDKFTMPNPDLPVLTEETFSATPPDEQAVFDFMAQTVKPEMAILLGLPEKTEESDGFACMNCHTFGE